MRRRQRERAQPANTTPRKRKNRSVEGSEEEGLISDLGELLRAEEAASAWWKDDLDRPTDDSLAELLQELAACEEGEAALGHQAFQLAEATSAPPNMAPAANQRAARGGNKNAVAARLNRLRKKEYVSGLEGKVARLSEDNLRLERENRGLGARVRQLEEETRYLRAVLANDSALSNLLGRLTGLGGVKLSTSLYSEMDKEPREHDYALPAEERETPSGGGVCLHVDQNKVSVEFCPACARSAATTTKM
uniref:X-box-binding protein 1 n=1 Tax=Pyxicephalus adspersus TaxID=30357 RepID=A0AAV3ATY4_PYXAD|nr:TPA: hypothetical protein GDO54_000192 [Pyxicephalus adspersus]